VALLGIDIGTSGPKAAVFSMSGDQISAASTSFSCRQPAARGELHPEDLWEAIKIVVRKAVGGAPQCSIKAVSISSQGETFVPVDHCGRPLTTFITNVDSAANKEANQLAIAIGQKRMGEAAAVRPPQSPVRVCGSAAPACGRAQALPVPLSPWKTPSAPARRNPRW
jgi:xylulokinase